MQALNSYNTDISKAILVIRELALQLTNACRQLLVLDSVMYRKPLLFMANINFLSSGIRI